MAPEEDDTSGRPRSRARSRRRTNRDERQRGGVHSISHDARFDQVSDNFEPLACNTVNINAVERDEVYANLRITLKDRPDTPATLRVKVDTGAQGNVMPLRTSTHKEYQCEEALSIEVRS